jgi:hypothetical protein
MEGPGKIKRQAVVVIHGMGEQRPMDTLRNFVAGVKEQLEKNDPAEKDSVVRSKPDSIGDIYETVRLSMDSTSQRPITDFYEFYWAHNMRDTGFSHMMTWMKQLVFTKVGKVPPRLKVLWYTVWSLIIAVPLLVLVKSLLADDIAPIKKILAPVLTAAIFPVILSAIVASFKSMFLNSAGDAARYFTPKPENIGERSQIRQQGISFLKKLHELSTNEKVDRIIIVAHSLGTVVAYDLLRLLWTEYNTTYKPVAEVNQERIKELNAYANGTMPLTPENLAAFRDLQFQCWQEQCTTGNKWLISDFITLGAAINAIDYFMVSNVDTEILKQQRELPVCPPVPDEKDHKIYYYSYPPYEIDGQKRTVKLLNHAALFAVTRWTNIYYTSDFVGGAMQRVFGKGIQDIEIKRESPWFLPGGHTNYWDKEDNQNALKDIVSAMNLSYQSSNL